MRIAFFVMIFWLGFNLKAQIPIQLGGQIAQLIPNHPRFPATQGPCLGFQAQYTFARPLRQHGRPVWGLELQYTDLGQAQTLGQALHALPFLHWRSQKNHQFRLGLGAAYLNRRYDTGLNPDNTAVGAYLNVAALAAYRWSTARFYTELGLWHYSNAGRANPNLGLNAVYLTAGFRFQSGQPQHLPKETGHSLDSAYHLALNLDAAWQARAFAGPAFPIYGLQIQLQKRQIQARAWGLGYAFHYPTGAADWQRLQGHDWQAISRHLLFISHEWLFDHWSFTLKGGVHLRKHLDWQSPWAAALALRFYPYLRAQGPFFGAEVRSNFGQAEWLAWQLGWSQALF